MTEYIQFEEIEETSTQEQPVIAIAKVPGKGYNIISTLDSPLHIAQILTGLANHILENLGNGSNDRTFRFPRRG
jgi:hypothetical protein